MKSAYGRGEWLEEVSRQVRGGQKRGFDNASFMHDGTRLEFGDFGLQCKVKAKGAGLADAQRKLQAFLRRIAREVVRADQASRR